MENIVFFNEANFSDQLLPEAPLQTFYTSK